jgi:hypothetical protein
VRHWGPLGCSRLKQGSAASSSRRDGGAHGNIARATESEASGAPQTTLFHDWGEQEDLKEIGVATPSTTCAAPPSHEAGHCVAALAFGIPVISATIEGN